MKKYQALIGIIISAFFLFLAFRQSDFREIYNQLQSVSVWPVLLGVGLLFLSFLARAFRWKFLLSSGKDISMDSLFGAVMIGYMSLNILPLRLGEFIRAYVLGRRESISTTAVFATVVMERIFDGFTVLLILLISVWALPISISPKAMDWVKAFSYFGLALYITAMIVVILIRVNIKIILNLTDFLLTPFPGLKPRAKKTVENFAQGLSTINNLKSLLIILALSLLTWGLIAAHFWLMLMAFKSTGGVNLGFEIGYSGALFLMAAIALGVMIPAGPAFVGTFEIACITSLVGLGVARPIAESYAILTHAVQFLPVTLVGIVYLYAHHFTLSQIRASGEEAKGMMDN